jgi:hypothetical protein
MVLRSLYVTRILQEWNISDHGVFKWYVSLFFLTNGAGFHAIKTEILIPDGAGLV